MRKVAVLVAVETYSDKRISRVKYAEADARELAAALQEHGLKSEDQTVLINVAATRATIKSRVRKVLAGLAEADMLYFYYAGHGFARNAQNYITCFDTSLDDLEDTSIPVEWLFGQFRHCASKKIVMFLDSCESGMLASTTVRSIYTDLTEDEIDEFFKNAEHCVCFAACKPGENSQSSEELEHGIWTYHLIGALNGKATKALEKGKFLTSSSLQNYLSTEVPRTLRTTHTGTVVQTPWLYGALSSDFLVADISPILAKRRTAANPNAQQLKYIRLCHESGLSVRSLSGFQKGHHVPDRVNDASERFVARIASKDVEEDIDKVRDSLRNTFGFKRNDLKTDLSDGEGSIITPYFDYEMAVVLDPDAPSRVIWRRQVTNIRVPEQILTEEFEEVFSGMFDTLEFVTTGDPFNIESIIDQIEEMDEEDITVDYNRDLTRCVIKMTNIDSTISITSHTFSIFRTKGNSPRLLIKSFFEVQKQLINTYQLKQLPFSSPPERRKLLHHG